jgi:hypothetical protein
VAAPESTRSRPEEAQLQLLTLVLVLPVLPLHPLEMLLFLPQILPVLLVALLLAVLPSNNLLALTVVEPLCLLKHFTQGNHILFRVTYYQLPLHVFFVP